MNQTCWILCRPMWQ